MVPIARGTQVQMRMELKLGPGHASFLPFFKDIIYLFLEGGEKSEYERERNIDVWEKYPQVTSHTPPTGDLAHNPDMCPDWESNWQPFSLQAGAQSTEPHQPGQDHFSFTQNFKKTTWTYLMYFSE